MAKTREYMDYLDEHIGIAPANSQEELQAAELIADIMGDHGLEPVIEEFDSRPLAQAMPYVVGVLLFVLMIVQGVTGGAVHVVTLVISLVLAALIIVRQFAFDLFEGFGPAAGSQNVVAIHHAEGDKVVKGARPIVVVAHLDTPRESLLHGPMARMHAPLKQIFAPCAIVAVVSLVIQLLVFLPEPLRTFAWVIGIVALIPVLVLSVVSIADRHLPCTEGANDNKSSVAALLSIMDRVCPSDDRVTSVEASSRPRRRSADETEMPVQSATRVEVIEDVKGIRHGEEILTSLGILPATCEVIYEEPKVRIVEEQVEVNPFADGFEEDGGLVAAAPVAEAPAVDEEATPEDIDETEAELETSDSDAAYVEDEEDEEDFEEEAEELEGEDTGRSGGAAAAAAAAAVGSWFSDRISSLRERIAARRERALKKEEETAGDEESKDGRNANQGDSEWFEDESDDFGSEREDEGGTDADHEDEGYDYEGDYAEEGDEYYDDDYADDGDDEDEPYEDDLAPLSADMVGSGRPSAARKSERTLEWDDEKVEEEEYADDEEYDDEREYADEGDDRYADEEAVEDDYEDGAYEDYEDYEDDESDEYNETDESDEGYEDYEDGDYEDDEPQDEVGEDEPSSDKTPRGDSDDDEWIDWEEEDGAESEPADDQADSYEDAEPQQGFPSRIKAFFRKHFSSQPHEPEDDEYGDDDYDDYDDDYEDDDYYGDSEDELESDDERFYDERDQDDAAYDDEAYEEQDSEDVQDGRDEPDEQAADTDDGDWVGEPLAEDYDDDYGDYEYDDSDFDREDSFGNTPAEPFNDSLSDPNELHFDREEDDDILPRDTTGLDTISDSYDLIETAPEPQRVDSPTPIDDPNWGVSSFTPARPAVNIARRAALFDLPDPTYATPDPLRPEDEYEDDYEDDYEGDDEYYDDYEDDAEPYDYEEEVRDTPDDDSARGDWKGGATMRSDVAPDKGAAGADVDTLKDAILELGDDFLVAHDIWFVVTGASAADHSGIKAFLDEHRRDVRGAFLVNLDSVGAGALGVYVREGLREPRRADRRLVRMLKDVAGDLHIALENASMTWDETEAATPMRSRLRAVTLVGLDDTDQPALSHTRADIPDNVNPKQVSDVVRIVCELIRRS